jgi:phage-related protein
MNYITFNNVRSDQLGIYVSTFPNYPYPEKDVESVTIPGRNGNVIFDAGTYKNVSVTYDVSIYEPIGGAALYSNVDDRMRAIVKWLHPATFGYCELRDTFYPGYYRLAICRNAGEVENLLNTVGKARIIFDCRPERFKDGMQFWLYTQGGTIRNTTNNIAAFDIRTVANYPASFSVENAVYPKYNCSFSITSGASVTFDGDTLDGGSVANNSRLITATAMPRLVPGDSTLTVSSGRVEVRVREWIL